MATPATAGRVAVCSGTLNLIEPSNRQSGAASTFEAEAVATGKQRPTAAAVAAPVATAAATQAAAAATAAVATAATAAAAATAAIA